VLGHESPVVRAKLERFFSSVAEMFEAWVLRSDNPHTQRCYRRDVMSFVEFLGLAWPQESPRLLQTSVAEVREWRRFMDEELDYAPKTLNRRLSSVAGLFRFLREAAADAKLPINIQNPAHRDFIARPATDPVAETRSLSPGNARKLMGLPAGESVLEIRDRAVLKFYLFTGCRIATGCRLNVDDFHMDEHDASLRIREKGHGKAKRTIGVHAELAEAIQEYIQAAGLTAGPLFRPRASARSSNLAPRAIGIRAMYNLIRGYLEQLPRAMRPVAEGSTLRRCIYTPHSLRATTATLLLKAGVELVEVQELLGHKHVTTSQIYDKRVRQTRDSASHKIPF
jgi:integrase/recombinase XerD